MNIDNRSLIIKNTFIKKDAGIDELTFDYINYVNRNDIDILSYIVLNSYAIDACKNEIAKYKEASGILELMDEKYNFKIKRNRKIKCFNEAGEKKSLEISFEESECQIFKPESAKKFCHRLTYYQIFKEFDEETEYRKETDGYGVTNEFKKALRKYILEFGEKQIFDDICITLSKGGEFIPIKEGEKVKLKGTENDIFNFYCFLYLNDFWIYVEDIRDFNHIRKPLFIYGMEDILKENEKMLSDLESFGRQVFIEINDEQY